VNAFVGTVPSLQNLGGGTVLARRLTPNTERLEGHQKLQGRIPGEAGAGEIQDVAVYRIPAVMIAVGGPLDERRDRDPSGRAP
jgi:hypothetical protein